ncbi:hypothetical protein KA005_73100, partial [bacterium]|nr:hypothetical protein [bacterium]
GFDIPYFIAKQTIIINYFNLIVFGAALVGMLVIISHASRNSKQKVFKYEYLLYIPIYPIINLLLWMNVFMHEATGREYKW